MSPVVTRIASARARLREGIDTGTLLVWREAADEISTDNIRIDIQDVQYVTSYDWMTDPGRRHSPKNGIVVPGRPPRWINPKLPLQVLPDGEDLNQIRDVNAEHNPRYPLLPIFIGASLLNKTIEWPEVDIITDRNNLRKLRQWAGGQVEDFRIDIEMVNGKTILMQRWELSKGAKWKAHNAQYGRRFRADTTEREILNDSKKEHQRVIQYDFGGINMVVRFQVEAYLPSRLTPRSVDPFNNNEIRQGALAEIHTTRDTEHDPPNLRWDDIYPQLFFSQISHHLIGVHNGTGGFTKIIHQDLAAKNNNMDSIAQTQEDALKVVRALLGQLREQLQWSPEYHKCALLCEDGVLKLGRRVSKDGLIPGDVMREFKPLRYR
ncbi:hypothetical protein K474DRAFT_1776843 [Panus rudis PR-1116 ss-1]|nr:hypothetical protein K474DRAFT_1776843 [Panus rudis PR-1116 ss-1]